MQSITGLSTDTRSHCRGSAPFILLLILILLAAVILGWLDVRHATRRASAHVAVIGAVITEHPHAP